MIKVKIKTKGIDIPKVMRGINVIHDQFTRQLTDNAIVIMKSLVPVASGHLKNSIVATGIHETKSGGLDRRYNVSVFASAFYARFISQGTRSSGGRYVPELDRRIETGDHPGTRADNFLVETAIILEIRAKEIGNRLYGTWKRSWGVVR